MKHFEVEQETVRYYRELLADNPLVYSSASFSSLYREFDSKNEETDYIEIEFIYGNADQTHKVGSNVTIDIFWTLYARNPILANRAITDFYDLIKDKTDNLGNTLQNLKHHMGTARINNNKFSKKLHSQIFFTNC